MLSNKLIKNILILGGLCLICCQPLFAENIGCTPKSRTLLPGNYDVVANCSDMFFTISGSSPSWTNVNGHDKQCTNCQIYISGRQNVHINNYTVTNTSAVPYVIRATPVSLADRKVELLNVTVDGGVYGVETYHNRHLVMDNCRVNGQSFIGVADRGGRYSTSQLFDTQIHNSGMYGYWVLKDHFVHRYITLSDVNIQNQTHTGAYVYGTVGSLITDNYFKNTGEYGLYIDQNAGLYLVGNNGDRVDHYTISWDKCYNNTFTEMEPSDLPIIK